jgi:hypothetical protein
MMSKIISCPSHSPEERSDRCVDVFEICRKKTHDIEEGRLKIVDCKSIMDVKLF